MEIISFNGRTYHSLEEMPAEQRAAYEQVMSFLKDENNNGIPDMLEGDAIQKIMGITSTRVVVNGQEVQSVDALSPEARVKFDQAVLKLNQLGILPKETQTAQQPVAQIAPSEPAFAQSPAFLQSSPSAISEETQSHTGTIIAIVVVVLLLCALVAAAFLFLNH